jgi:hypothetical protein
MLCVPNLHDRIRAVTELIVGGKYLIKEKVSYRISACTSDVFEAALV